MESDVSELEESDSLLPGKLLWVSDWSSALLFSEESSAELSVVPASEESASLFRESFCVSSDWSSSVSLLSSVLASFLLLSELSFLESLPPNRSLKNFLILPQNPLSSLLSSELLSEELSALSELFEEELSEESSVLLLTTSSPSALSSVLLMIPPSELSLPPKIPLMEFQRLEKNPSLFPSMLFSVFFSALTS